MLSNIRVVEVIEIVDLSLPVDASTVVYPGDPQPRVHVHSTVERDGFNLLRLELGSQTGTHVDAPYHFDDAGARIDEVDLRRFAGPAVVVDATDLPPRGRITPGHLAHVRDRLGPGAVVLLRTGWTRHYGTPTWFAHPFLDVAACRELLAAGVRTIGVDAVNLDETPDEDHPGEGYPCHHLVAEVGGIIAENLTDLDRVEALVDPLVCLFPVRLSGADGAPVRAVAMSVRVGEGSGS